MTTTPKKHDYTTLDAAIIRRITEAAPASFSEVFSFNSDTMKEADALAAADFENSEAWRIVDRRLQALRKAGKIKYQRKSKAAVEGWVIA